MAHDIDLETGTHVVLGTGQVGSPVTRILLDGGADVRVANRSGTVPTDIDGDVDAVAADVSDSAEAREACAGASVVYFCLQPPYDKWPELFPPLIEGAIDGAARADATFVMADNLYAYGPVSGPIHEDLPARPTSEKGETRARMVETVLDAHEAGSLQATVGRASDFYGPGVTGSIVGEHLFSRILDGKTVWFPGDPDAPHTYTYVRDFARALVMLGSDAAALGGVWHAPSAETLTTREFVALAGDVAGTEPTVRPLPSWLLRLSGVVSTTMRQLHEIQYQFADPFVVSHEKFGASFDFTPTPHREAVERTLDWYRTTR